MSVPLFVAKEIGHTLIDENVWMPTVTIDVSQSPEVADLARVHAVEGIGDVSTHAIRQDDDVAQLMGVNTLKYKVWAFVLGAAVAGAGGVIYASQILSIVPDQFNLNLSILILACVVFGGIGNLWGVILGAALLAFTPERIRFLSQPRILVFGIALVVMMNLRPDGILPKKKREHFDPNWKTVEESGEGEIK